MVYIYILKLVKNKFYVRKTLDQDFRIESHFDSNKSVWTKKYPPIALLELIPNCDDCDEDKFVRIVADRHGIGNVRGNESTLQLWKMM